MTNNPKNVLHLPRKLNILHKLNIRNIYFIMKILNRLDNYINDKNYSMIYKYNKLDIINYTEIVDFTSKIITIRHNNNIYQIKGSNLVIARMMDNEILISGNIENITFM